MKGKMKIGIIGTGNIGSALVPHFTSLRHDVVVANPRGPETLTRLAKDSGAKPVTVEEVPRDRALLNIYPERQIVRCSSPRLLH